MENTNAIYLVNCDILVSDTVSIPNIDSSTDIGVTTFGKKQSNYHSL